jgi:hypothetical protein
MEEWERPAKVSGTWPPREARDPPRIFTGAARLPPVTQDMTILEKSLFSDRKQRQYWTSVDHT